MARLRGSIVCASDTDPDLCPSINSAVNSRELLAQLSSAPSSAPFRRWLHLSTLAVSTEREVRSQPVSFLLHGSLASNSSQCFTTSCSATASVVGGQKAFSWHDMLGDRRHLLCQSLWNGGLSSREKIAFQAAEFAAISKCQFAD